jgi:drug/metabolite transporter (DMT)-like permease
MPVPDVLLTPAPQATAAPQATPAPQAIAAATAPPAATAPAAARPALAGVATGIGAMVCVGGSVAVSGVLVHAPVFTAEALRYAMACVILLVLARLAGRRLVLPHGTEWLWLAGLAATGLVLFNVALVAGSRHAEPAVLGVAVACVPAVLAVIGPVLEGSRPHAAGVTAALVVTCGAALVQGVGRTDGLGVAWAAVVFGCEAAFTLLAIPVLGRHGPWGVSVHTTWIAAAVFAVIGLVHEGRHLPGRSGDRGGVRHVVFQRGTAGRQPGRPAHRRGPCSRRRGRRPARRPRPPSPSLGRHHRRRRRPGPRPAPRIRLPRRIQATT